MPEDTPPSATRMESRWVAFLTAIALAFGGVWLQNQWATSLRLADQIQVMTAAHNSEMSALMRHVDDKYVQKDLLVQLDNRLKRIEGKIDELKSSSGSPPHGIRE